MSQRDQIRDVERTEQERESGGNRVRRCVGTGRCVGIERRKLYGSAEKCVTEDQVIV